MLHRRRATALTDPDPFSREIYVARFGLSTADLSDERVDKILTYKRGLDVELKRLKAGKAAYPDERVEKVAKFYELGKADLQRPAIAKLVKAILDSEDYIHAIKRHEQQ